MNLMHALLKEGMIRVKQPAADWKDAVKMGVGCLVGAGKADWGYYNAIIRSVSKNGPYFVLMPGVALPHARPDEGVISTGFSLVTLDEPVDFGSPENDPISVLLSFCSTDSVEMVEKTMVEAVSLFEDEQQITRIMNATTIGAIEKILRKIEKRARRILFQIDGKNFGVDLYLQIEGFDMTKKEIVLKNENGLHMRPGRLFVQEAKKQSCAVSIMCKDKNADAKSLVQVLKMGIGKGSTVTLLCDGKDEQKSADHLEQFIGTLEG